MNINGHRGKSFTRHELEVIAMSSRGMTVRDAAKEMNCSTTTVIKARRECGIESPKCGAKKSKEVETRREKMQTMLDNNYTADQVADEFGVSSSYVKKFTTPTKKAKSKKAPRFNKTQTSEYKADSWLMQELRDSGMVIAKIAEKFDVSVGNVARRTSKPLDIVSLTKLQESLPKKEVRVTFNGEIIGTFTPAKSAH